MCLVGLWGPPRPVIYRMCPAHRRMGETLVPLLKELLRASLVSFREVSLVAVASGPGSYTGTRLGIAVARALRFAWGVQVVGVPSFAVWAEALRAHPPGPGPHVVVLEAGRGRVYMQGFHPTTGAALWDPLHMSRAQVPAHLPPPPFVLAGEAGSWFRPGPSELVGALARHGARTPQPPVPLYLGSV